MLGEYFISVIVVSSQYQMIFKWDTTGSIYKKFSSVKMSKQHAHVANMAMHITHGGALPHKSGPVFSNNIDLKTNNRNYVKLFWILCGSEIASINLFQVDLDISWNYLWYCYVKGTCAPVAPPFKGRGGSVPVMYPRSGVPVCSHRSYWSLLKTVRYFETS